MKNIKKKFTKKLITVFLSAFFVFSTISVVACGSTSEFTYHSRKEAKEVMAFAKKVIAG